MCIRFAKFKLLFVRGPGRKNETIINETNEKVKNTSTHT